MHTHGLRGKSLATLRRSRGVGQRHLARVLGLQQPDISRLENEVYGGLPRGFSTRYQQALDNLGPHFPGCGCNGVPVAATTEGELVA